VRARKAELVAAAAVCVGLLAAGCGGGQPAGDGLDAQSLLDLERSQRQRVEELVAECMRAEGFAYEPRAVTVSGHELPTGSPFDPTLTRERAQRNGFGIVDGLRQGVDSGAHQPGAAPGDATGGGPDDEDGAAGRAHEEARDLAMLGNPGTGSPGCRARAEAQAREELAGSGQLVDDLLVEVSRQIEADPRYHEMWADWSRCMAAEGIDAPDLTALTRSLAAQARELLVPAAGPPPGAASAGPEARPGVPDPRDLEELRSREIRAATAAVDCFDPLLPRHYEIVSDAERAARGGS
jgi:hypothetical protein